MYSLCIETSTSLCSVALGHFDKCTDVLEINDINHHSKHLHLLIKDILIKNKISFNNLSYICTSSGPGSYTGLRIGATTTKTLAYTLQVPLIDISSLQTQAECFILNENKILNSSLIVSTMYGRGNKIYFGIYSTTGNEIKTADALIINFQNIEWLYNEYFKNIAHLVLIGSGAGLLNKELQNFILQSQNKILNIKIYQDILPSAKGMIKEGYKKFSLNKFSDFVYFEPRYI